MRSKKTAVFAMIFVIIIAAALMKREIDRNENRVEKITGIYILRDNYEYEDLDVQDFKVDSETVEDAPFISGEDIMLYRWKDHRWALTQEAKDRILDMKDIDQKLFVFVVEDKPQYFGQLLYPVSSKKFNGPVIILDDLGIQGIDKSYPEDLNVTDLRDDKEVEEYFKKSNKLAE